MGMLRRWGWLVLLVLLVAGRAVLPEVLRGQIETRASEALGAVVRVGDVDLGLLAGVVALEDVAVQTHDAAPEERPLIAWKRFAVDLRWLPLVRKTVRLAVVELEEPDVAVDRLHSGELNLMALAPGGDGDPADAEEEAAEPSGWRFGIDYLALRRGGLRFRDFLIGDPEPIQLALESIEVRDIALAPEVYDDPADIRFVVRLEEGALRVRARFTPRADGQAVDVTIDGSRIPVRRSRVYVPGVAWSELTGLLSLGLRYRLETGGRNDVAGTVGLDELRVWTGGLEEPALAWESLAVALERVDLVTREARLGRVALAGAVVPVRPRAPEPLPLLATARAAREAAKTDPAAAKPAAGAADPAKKPDPAAKPDPDKKPDPAAAAEPGPPWTWHVAELAVADSRVRLLAEKPLDVGVTLGAKGLSGPTHDGSPVRLDLAVADGTAGLDGTLRLAPLGFAGGVTTGALDVPRLLDVAGAVRPGVLQIATLDADLEVALGSKAPIAGDATLSGTATIADLWMEAFDPKEFSAGAPRIALDLESVTLPGVLADAPARDRGVTAALRSVAVDQLYARVTRTDAGVVVPDLTPEPAPAPKAADATGRAKAAAAPAADAAGPPPAITIGTLTLAKGRVDVTDRTVKPFYWTAFDPIDAELADVRLPAVEIGRIQLVAVNTKQGVVEVKGGLTKKSDLELVVKELPLMPFNPYVTGASPYSISRGSLFVTTKASIDGSRYDTTTWLTLSDFDLASRSGKHIVLEQLGIPLTVAVALLRDWKGNIDLTIPVQVDEKGTRVGLGSIVTEAIVRALVGTLTSPLKIMGFVLPRGGGSGDASLAPVPIAFRPGLATLDEQGREQVEQLAAFMAGRPGLGVTLAAPPTAADVRALREQDLLERLGPRAGVLGRLRNLGARGRIVDALAARADGEAGALDADDAAELDEYLEDVPAPAPERLRALAEARLALVETALREDYGIDASQIARGREAPGEPVEGEPGVRVDLGSARR